MTTKTRIAAPLRRQSFEQPPVQEGKKSAVAYLSVVCVGGLLAALITATLTFAGAALIPLDASDPPEVIQSNHQFNLGLLHRNLDEEIAMIKTVRDQTVSGCPTCRDKAWADAAQQVAAARDRYALAVEEENLAFQSASRGAKDRLTKEAEQRAQKLREAEKARADERTRNIKKFATRRSATDTLLTEEEAATGPAPAGSYGNTAARFRPSRHSYQLRDWKDTETNGEPNAVPFSADGARESARGREESRDVPVLREDQLKAEIERLESYVTRNGPSKLAQSRIVALRKELSVLSDDTSFESKSGKDVKP